MHFLLISLIALALISGCRDDDGTGGSGDAYRDEYFEDLFTRDGGGWTGGDGAYSVALPDGRTLWLFGDSFLDTVYADGSRPNTSRMIRNAAMVQDGAEMTTLYSGTQAEPSALFAPEDSSLWYWPLDGIVEDDSARVFLMEMKRTGPGGWDFEFTGVIDIATLTLPDLTVFSINTVISGSLVAYGAAVMEDSEHVFIYGVEDEQYEKHFYAARAFRGSVLGGWEFYDGTDWSSEPAGASRILTGISNQFSVIKTDEIYHLITQSTMFGDEIYSYEADTPTGPWKNRTVLYRTPETGGNIYTYNAVAHPQFTTNGELLISYNVNSFVFQDVFDDAYNYRPRFIRAPGF